MPRFLTDSFGLSWMILAPSRRERLHDSEKPEIKGECVFCPGNEKLNRETGRTVSDDSRWLVRVIENKFPIAEYHEVIIHSPQHDLDFQDFSKEQMGLVLKTFVDRFNFHLSAGHGRVLIFYNHNIHAGATIKHSHSQLVVIPENIRINGILKQPVENVVWETSQFVLYCPRYSEWPYEIWVAPKSEQLKRSGSFGQVTDSEVEELAGLVPKICRAIVTMFAGHESLHKHPDQTDVPFNFYIYHGQDWFIRFIPRLIHPGGFELATKMNVNVVDPSKAAKEYGDFLEGEVV